MPTTRSLDEMMALAAQHTMYEFMHEIEPLMKTVHPEPCWIYEPMGCEISSLEGVSQMYQRMFPTIGAMGAPNVVNMWYADDGMIGEVLLTKPTADGGEITVSQFSWCEFNGDLISGECNYMDAGEVDSVAHTLGADFFTLPGVSVTALEP